MQDEISVQEIERVETRCPACSNPSFGAAGRGFCQECFLTFPLPQRTRKQLLNEFEQRYYKSATSPFYHREGCKYLKCISKENLLVLTEPSGKPCSCVR